MRNSLLALTALLIAIACSAGTPAPSPTPTPSVLPSPTPTPTPSPTLPPPSPSPTPGGELSPAQVRYLIIDQLGPLHYCDPDEYPISHGDEPQKAAEQFPIIQADTPTFAAITQRLGIAGQTDFSDAEVLAIYREWKALNAVDAQPLGDGTYSFDVTTEGDAASGRALHLQGTVDAAGTISIATQEEIFGTSCPICLAQGTLIDTPAGLVPVEQLKPGDPIWTVDADGRRVASTVARVGSVAVPSSHQVVDLVLSDGRHLRVSPGHPLTDGRLAGDLRVGDVIDGASVVSAELVGYDAGRTYDVLANGATGFYWANGVLLDSTLH